MKLSECKSPFISISASPLAHKTALMSPASSSSDASTILKSEISQRKSFASFSILSLGPTKIGSTKFKSNACFAPKIEDLL